MATILRGRCRRQPVARRMGGAQRYPSRRRNIGMQLWSAIVATCDLRERHHQQDKVMGIASLHPSYELRRQWRIEACSQVQQWRITLR
jgi:hypothetical protein